MKQKIRHLYLNTSLGYVVLHPFFLLYEYGLQMIPDKTLVKRKFLSNMGRELDLENPRTLNEKINFLKIYERHPLLPIAADKYKVRDYIKKTIGEEYLIPLVLHTKNPEDIVPENLPDYPVIIKTNHNSSGGIIVKDKSSMDWKAKRKLLAKLLRENHYYSTREWQYKDIEPRIVVEKLMTDTKGNIPDDYKLHCFNGKLVFTQVDLDRHTDHKRNLYDVEWNQIPCKWIYENGAEVTQPDNYLKMKELAEIIAQDFTYVRVDFYSIGASIFFGELTFHSDSGFGKFIPDSYDSEFGKMLDITSVNKK
ncbi:ATP-grasp fold amidoligase family protein [Flagellimonas marinaquae]